MSCVLFRMIDWNCDDWHSLVLVELVEDGKCWCEENWFHWLQIRSTRCHSCNERHTHYLDVERTRPHHCVDHKNHEEGNGRATTNQNLKWRMKEYARLEYFLKINLSNYNVHYIYSYSIYVYDRTLVSYSIMNRVEGCLLLMGIHA